MKEKNPLSHQYDPKHQQAEQCAATGHYFKTQGYRKVAGNSCYRGLDRNPIKISCSGAYVSSHKSWIAIAVVIAVIGGCLYYGPPLELFEYLKDKFSGHFSRARNYAESLNLKDEKPYEQVGFGAVPDHYEPDEDEDDTKLTCPKSPPSKEEKGEKEVKDDLMDPLEL